MIRAIEDIRKLCATESGKKSALDFQALIIDNIKGLDRKLSGRLVTVTVLCVLFELLDSAAISEISITGIRISDYGILDRILPVLIAYLYFECIVILTGRRLLEEVHDSIIEHTYPDLYMKDLELYLRPPHLIKTYDILIREAPGRSSKILEWSLRPTIVMIIFAVPAFIVYSGWVNLTEYGYADWPSWIGIAISVLFLLQPILLLASLNRATGSSGIVFG